MKIKRFSAPDMRAAIKQIREEQGPDAVILSSNKVAGGVEIIAATDYDDALVKQAALVAGGGNPRSRDTQAESISGQETPSAHQATGTEQENEAGQSKTTVADNKKTGSKIVWAQDPAISKLRSELHGLRLSLEGQLRSLNYDLHAPSAEHSDALRTLTGIGLDTNLARHMVAGIGQNVAANQIRSHALVQLAKRLPVSKLDRILAGGHVALIGPTGVGKTTTIAKLAAYYAMSRSSRDVALVTTDHYRIGAQDQLFTYGRLLGMPVHALKPRESLSELLAKLSDYRLVLIDTAGMPPRDPRLSQQLAALNLGAKIKNYLVMPASGQAQDLDELASRFADVPLCGCIITKLDETSRLGGALSVAIRRQLSIDFLCDGQRVPEDLHRTKPNELVVRAMRAAGHELPPRPAPNPAEPPLETQHACS